MCGSREEQATAGGGNECRFGLSTHDRNLDCPYAGVNIPVLQKLHRNHLASTAFSGVGEKGACE